jgi:hypothetical protein
MRVGGLAALIAVALCIGVGALFRPVLMNWWTLSQSSARTTGVVVEVDRTQHNTALYTYNVGGRHYRGSHLAYGGIAGDRVVVHYSPARPELSMLGDPVIAFRRGLFGTGMVFAFVGLLVLVATKRATRGL